MQIHVAPGSDLPIYRQIMRQIQDAIAGGILRAGDKLSSHRDLAEQLVIAPLTVKKAYDELEREGLLHTERGRGTFVSSKAVSLDQSGQRQRLHEMARRLLTRARLAGLDLASVQSLLEAVQEELEEEWQETQPDRSTNESGGPPQNRESGK